MTRLRLRLIKSGDGCWLFMPRAVWSPLRFQEEVELEVRADQLVVRRIPGPRLDWEKQFAAMAANNDDQFLDNEAAGWTEWDEAEWEW